MGTTEQTTHILQSLESNILQMDTPEHFVNSLDDLFSCFINDDTGLANEAIQRSRIYMHYLNLKAFLQELK